MAVSGLFGILGVGALLTGFNNSGIPVSQSPPRWAWFVVASLFAIAAVEAGRRAARDRRRLRSQSLWLRNRTSPWPP